MDRDALSGFVTDSRFRRFLGFSVNTTCDEVLNAIGGNLKAWILSTPCGLADECALAKRCPRPYQDGARSNPEVSRSREARPLEKLPVHVVDRVQVIRVPAQIGAAEARMLTETVLNAAGSTWIRGVLFWISCCTGATVTDRYEFLLRTLEAVRGCLPVAAYIDRQATSGAYVLAAAAHLVIAAPKAIVGGIGAVALYCAGGVPHVFATSRHKRKAAWSYGRPTVHPRPFTVMDILACQNSVDTAHEMCVRRIALFRNLPEEHVRRCIADGRRFLARKAIQRGMLDRVAHHWGDVLAIAADFVNRRGN